MTQPPPVGMPRPPDDLLLVADCGESGCEDLTEAQELVLWEHAERLHYYASRLEAWSVRAWRLCGEGSP